MEPKIITATPRVIEMFSRAIRLRYHKLDKLVEQFKSSSDEDKFADVLLWNTKIQTPDIPFILTHTIEYAAENAHGMSISHVFNIKCYLNDTIIELKTIEGDEYVENVITSLGTSLTKPIEICGDCLLAVVEFDGLCGKCYVLTKLGDENCCICAENSFPRVWAKISTCGHVFHKGCILRCVNYGDNGKCPLCRGSIRILTQIKEL